MATVKLWSIKSRLDVVVNYTTNEEKVSSDDYINLHNAVEYIEADYKTESKQYVSTLNCGVNSAYEEMKITKEQWNKKDGIIGFHGYQSFKGQEVTPEVAHEIGVKLANELWGDRFEVIITTHLNTNNIHNHFVLNSVSFKDGKKYYDTRESYARMREVCNAICQEYGISYFKEKTSRKSGINYGAYYEKYKQHDNYYTTTKEDIDRVILQANSYRDFENILKAMKYELIYRAGKLSVRKEPYKKNIRVHRSFGEDYTRESIENRISKDFITTELTDEVKKEIKYYIKFNDVKKEKAKGIYGLYLHYCYILKVFPVKYPKKILSPEIRAEIKKLDEISKQTNYLVKNEIKTDNELIDRKDKYSNLLNESVSKRENLWKQFNRTDNVFKQDYIKKEIDSLSINIKEYRKEVMLCNKILDRLDIVKDNIEKHYEVRKER